MPDKLPRVFSEKSLFTMKILLSKSKTVAAKIFDISYTPLFTTIISFIILSLLVISFPPGESLTLDYTTSILTITAAVFTISGITLALSSIKHQGRISNKERLLVSCNIAIDNFQTINNFYWSTLRNSGIPAYLFTNSPPQDLTIFQCGEKISSFKKILQFAIDLTNVIDELENAAKKEESTILKIRFESTSCYIYKNISDSFLQSLTHIYIYTRYLIPEKNKSIELEYLTKKIPLGIFEKRMLEEVCKDIDFKLMHMEDKFNEDQKNHLTNAKKETIKLIDRI